MRIPVRRLHVFMLKTFLPLFAMTFFIVLFIVLMQFLWKFIDDLVGKGLSLGVLGELFFYAAVSMVPMALPLAILLASLMTFGNLGERLELTAMKASGISLIRVMMPLVALVGAISIGAFFFQNDVLPKAQVKMWTLLFSVKQKSPELEIPEGVFYDQIPGYNLFVQQRDKETGVLHNLMIYDVSHGGDNSTILMADSGRLAFTKDMKFLYLHLFDGEQFENLRDQSNLDRNVPFRREQFVDKEVLIPFDANFNRLDDNTMRRQYVGKNIAELRQTIDSVGERVDSIGQEYARQLQTERMGGYAREMDEKGTPLPYVAVKMAARPQPLDTMLARLSAPEAKAVYEGAIASVMRKRGNYEFRAISMDEDKKTMRRHEIELMKKFTLSVACLIFFFIGAPLGAIIRKGGLGTPLVVSVFLFLIYYIIDNTGYKMARDGRWVVWFGMWLSTFILAPLGVYVTYKAMNDSAVFDKDTYIRFFHRLLGIRDIRKVNHKEVIINDISLPEALERMRSLAKETRKLAMRYRKPCSYINLFLRGYDLTAIRRLGETIDSDVDYLTDCRDLAVGSRLEEYPAIRGHWVMRPAFNRAAGWSMMILFPVGLCIWLVSLGAYKRLKADLKQTASTTAAIASLLRTDIEQSQQGGQSII